MTVIANPRAWGKQFRQSGGRGFLPALADHSGKPLGQPMPGILHCPDADTAPWHWSENNHRCNHSGVATLRTAAKGIPGVPDDSTSVRS